MILKAADQGEKNGHVKFITIWTSFYAALLGVALSMVTTEVTGRLETETTDLNLAKPSKADIIHTID